MNEREDAARILVADDDRNIADLVRMYLVKAGYDVTLARDGEEAQKLLARFGYGVNASGYFDGTTRDAVAAFQRHFRPARVDGVLDVSTLTTLKALIAERDAKLAQATAKQA